MGSPFSVLKTGALKREIYFAAALSLTEFPLIPVCRLQYDPMRCLRGDSFLFRQAKKTVRNHPVSKQNYGKGTDLLYAFGKPGEVP